MSGRDPDQAVRLAVNSQRWSALTFLHWPVDQDAVQDLLPPGLHAQTYRGRAWVGLTPFLMQDVRVPLFPPLPGWSTFPEINLRTYVRHEDGSDGLWFLNLWSTRRALNGALRLIGLPYRRTRAQIRRTGPGELLYDVHPVRGAPPLRLRAVVRAGEPVVVPAGLENWLTGRWNAYTERFGRVWRVPVTHPPWPLRQGTVVGLETNALELAGLSTPRAEPVVHVSPGVSTLIGLPRPTSRVPRSPQPVPTTRGARA